MNVSNIKTPGVYVNEISLFPPSVAQVETAIPAFIGYTQKDETGSRPTRITSLLEYESLFGTVTPQADIELTVTNATTTPVKIEFTDDRGPVLKGLLYYSMQMFFKNGGGPCYIVSTGMDTATFTKTALKAGLDKLEAFDEPTIIVIPDAVKLSDADAYELMNNALDQCAKLQDRFTIIDVKTNPDTVELDEDGEPVEVEGEPVILSPKAAFRQAINGDIEKAKYGAAYYPYLKTTLSHVFPDDEVTEAVSASTLTVLKTTDNVLYNKIKSALSAQFIELPPGGSVAGIYANVDGSRGVWKAPANVPVIGITGPSIVITDEDQADLNVDPVAGKSINAIRTFTGKGTLVWGARTLAGNDNEWRYVPVRRLFIMIEESVKKASARFVFEPNDANTWTKVKAMIENFLTVIWRDGALAGAKPEHAFFVKVGLGQTMSPDDINQGKMIVEIGLAAVRPAEFIILRFSHKMQES